MLYSLRYFCPVQLCGLAGALLSSHMTHANTAAYDLWRLREKENSQLHYEGASFPEYLFTEDQGAMESSLARSLSEIVSPPQPVAGWRMPSCFPAAHVPCSQLT